MSYCKSYFNDGGVFLRIAPSEKVLREPKAAASPLKPRLTPPPIVGVDHMQLVPQASQQTVPEPLLGHQRLLGAPSFDGRNKKREHSGLVCGTSSMVGAEYSVGGAGLWVVGHVVPREYEECKYGTGTCLCRISFWTVLLNMGRE